MKALVFILTLTAFLAAGCATPTEQPPPIVVSASQGPKEAAANELGAARASKAAAATRAALVANANAPQALPAVQLVAGELAVAIANQDQPTATDLKEALARVEKGKTDLAEAKREQAKAAEEAGTLRKQLEDAKMEAEKERKAAAELLNGREKLWTKQFITQGKRINSLKDEVDKARDATAKKVQFWFALILRLVAAGLLLVAGLKAKAAIATGLPGMEAVRGTLATVALSAAAFTLSWAVAQWWFYRACGGFAALVFGLWAAHAYFADKAKGTLNKIGEAIDAGKVVDSQGQAVSSTVDLAALGRAMNGPEKKLVSKLRNVRRVAKAKAAV